MTALLVMVGVAAAPLGPDGVRDDPPAGGWSRMPARGDVAAPVHYEDTMLILVTDKGVSRLAFG